MDPVTLTLMGAALGGGIISSLGGKKVIDPEWLKQKFGANAVNEETIALFNSVLNSPQGQQMMASAAEQGAQFGRDTQSAAAQAGIGAGGGASSGTGIFATSASEGAAGALQRDVKSNIFQQVLPIAQQLVGNRMNAYMGSYLQDQAQPTTTQRLGGAIGDAAGTALSLMEADKDRKAKMATAITTGGVSAAGANRVAAPTNQISATNGGLGYNTASPPVYGTSGSRNISRFQTSLGRNVNRLNTIR